MRPTEIEELKEIFKLLEERGCNPMLCDTEVPLEENPVRAGLPTAIGNLPTEMIMLPKALLSMTPELMIRVMGDSMVDVKIEEGDLVKMRIDKSPKTGDIVVVVIGTETAEEAFPAWLHRRTVVSEYRNRATAISLHRVYKAFLFPVNNQRRYLSVRKR